MNIIEKPIKVKPQFYSVYLQGLKEISQAMGYNILVHERYEPDNPKSHIELLEAFCELI